MKISFELGTLLCTPAALEYCESAMPMGALKLIARHMRGDWGDLDAEDKALNVQALVTGARIFSMYIVNDRKLYVITEAKDEQGRRQATTVLFAEEY